MLVDPTPVMHSISHLDVEKLEEHDEIDDDILMQEVSSPRPSGEGDGSGLPPRSSQRPRRRVASGSSPTVPRVPRTPSGGGGSSHRRRTTRREAAAEKHWGNASMPMITVRDIMGSEKKATAVGLGIAESSHSADGSAPLSPSKMRGSKTGAEQKRMQIRSRQNEKVRRKNNINSSLEQFLEDENPESDLDDYEEEDEDMISDEEGSDDAKSVKSTRSTKSNSRSVRRRRALGRKSDCMSTTDVDQGSSHSRRRSTRRRTKSGAGNADDDEQQDPEKPRSQSSDRRRRHRGRSLDAKTARFGDRSDGTGRVRNRSVDGEKAQRERSADAERVKGDRENRRGDSSRRSRSADAERNRNKDEHQRGKGDRENRRGDSSRRSRSADAERNRNKDEHQRDRSADAERVKDRRDHRRSSSTDAERNRLKDSKERHRDRSADAERNRNRRELDDSDKKPRSRRTKLSSSGHDDQDRHRSSRRSSRADDDDRSVGSRKSVGARRRRHHQQARSKKLEEDGPPTHVHGRAEPKSPVRGNRSPHSNSNPSSPVRSSRRGSAPSLSKHIEATPLTKPPLDLEDRSEESSKFTTTYEQPASLLQFDPTQTNNFTTVSQTAANIRSEKFRLSDGTESELHISELAGLPTFEAAPLADSPDGQKPDSRKHIHAMSQSMGSLGSFDDENGDEPPRSSRSMGSIGNGSDADVEGQKGEEKGVNQSARRGRGVVKTNSAGARRGVSATRSFLARVRKQERADKPVKPRNGSMESKFQDSMSFFGWNKKDGEDEEEGFFRRKKKDVEHQALDDDDCE